MARAEGKPTVDTTQLAKGIVGVTIDGDVKSARHVVQITHSESGAKYQYEVFANKLLFPLQSGDGTYKVAVLQAVGNKAKALINETVTAKITDQNARWLISPINNSIWTSQMASITSYGKMLADAGAKGDAAVKAMYKEMTANYVYDDQKATDISSGKMKEYYPVIDDVYKAKMGICYDYATLMASVMRSQGIPARVVMGYSPDIPNVYHAWNDVLINGAWVTMDTTYDAAYVQAEQGDKVNMSKDGSKYKVAKVY
jgi:transglutaminase-like putative cysteine protease